MWPNLVFLAGFSIFASITPAATSVGPFSTIQGNHHPYYYELRQIYLKGWSIPNTSARRCGLIRCFQRDSPFLCLYNTCRNCCRHSRQSIAITIRTIIILERFTYMARQRKIILLAVLIKLGSFRRRSFLLSLLVNTTATAVFPFWTIQGNHRHNY